MRRVGYPSHLRESRFRYFGTEGSFEQLATVSLWQDKQGVTDVSELVDSVPTMSPDDPALAERRPGAERRVHLRLSPGARHLPAARRSSAVRRTATRAAITSWSTTSSGPSSTARLPPVNAWTAARFNLPGIVAHAVRARRGRAAAPSRTSAMPPARDLARTGGTAAPR